MKKNKIIALVLLVISIFTLGMSSNVANDEYSNEYIALEYQSNWDKQVIDTADGESIEFSKDDFAFMISVEEKENNYNILEDTFKKHKKIEFANVISYHDITIDNQEGKKLISEFQSPEYLLEQLYHQLEKIEKFNSEIEEYLKQYDVVNIFVTEIKDNPAKLDKLEAIEFDNQTPTTVAKIEGLIDSINYNFSKDKSATIINQGIFINKGDIRLIISFDANEEQYDDVIEGVEKIIESIEFVE